MSPLAGRSITGRPSFFLLSALLVALACPALRSLAEEAPVTAPGQPAAAPEPAQTSGAAAPVPLA
ncbi:MAG: MFS transporter, partial [Gammaproteobacteria bacterium]